MKKKNEPFPTSLPFRLQVPLSAGVHGGEVREPLRALLSESLPERRQLRGDGCPPVRLQLRTR